MSIKITGLERKSSRLLTWSEVHAGLSVIIPGNNDDKVFFIKAVNADMVCIYGDGRLSTIVHHMSVTSMRAFEVVDIEITVKRRS